MLQTFPPEIVKNYPVRFTLQGISNFINTKI